MKRTLILPIAGRSSRFIEKKPKWILQHPSGKKMLTEAIRGLNPTLFNSICIISLVDYAKYVSEVVTEIKIEYHVEVQVVLLEKQTKSQPETIYKGIKQENITGAILIKDCDASFNYSSNWKQNHVAVADLHKVGKINAGNKSYVQIDSNKTLGNIAEKQVISNLFNCGCYYFISAKEFCNYYESIVEKKGLYISHIIYKMLLDNKIFFIEEVTDYVDWGEQEDWNHFKRKSSKNKTIVIDMDGTIAKLSNLPYANREVIQDVVNTLKKYKQNGFYIIITTSRQMNTYDNNLGIINKKTAPVMLNWLYKHNVPFDEIYYGRPWCGHNGFYVCDKTISPSEFVKFSSEEIKEHIKNGD